jgi:hypothetical protein
MSGVPIPYRFQYVHVAANETEYPLGADGQVGDYLHRIIVTLSTNNSANVTIGDGAFEHLIVPSGVDRGVYNLELNMVSQDGGFSITTSAEAEVLAVGIFTN